MILGSISALFQKSLFGEGTYLTSDLSLALLYSPHGLGWQRSALGSILSCVAVCEIIDHPDVKCQVKKKGESVTICPSCCFYFPFRISGSSSTEWETYLLVTLVWAIMSSIPRMTRSGIALSKLLTLFLDAEGFRGIPRLDFWLSYSHSSGGCVWGCWLFIFFTVT